MSYAIIQTGGKQYKVKAGEILKIERLEDSKLETKIEFKEILAYGDDKNIEVGSPTVEGAKVEADLVENGKNRTILIFKKRRRQNSKFCMVHDENNENLKAKLNDIKIKLKAGMSTIPSTIKDELECNIFLRSNNVETFSKWRELKDNF